MNTLRGCAEILLGDIPFEKATVYTERSLFYRYATRTFPQYSGDEIENIYEVHVKNKTVFDVIRANAEEFLEENERHALVCRTGQGLRWRSLFLKLGQDVFTTAFLAYRNKPYGFIWKSVIDIQAEGMPKDMKCAENHFHLNGSTQIFPLSFACIMNNIDGRHKDFKRLAHYYDNRSMLDVESIRYFSLYEKCRIAAAIRLYLFAKAGWRIDNIFKGSINHNLLDVDSTDESSLQRCIEAFRVMVSDNPEFPLLDYAQVGIEACSDTSSNYLGALAGERRFLFLCYRNVFDKDDRQQINWTDKDDHYFYIYLVLKNAFRRELLQTNGRLGFMNFSDYQDRKEIFIDKYKSHKRAAVQLAVNHTFNDGFVSSLEARICPKSKAKETRKAVLDIYDTAFPRINGNTNDREKFSLVLHFVKTKEESSYSDIYPRDFKKRKEVYSKAREIAIMLANRNSLRRHVRGIDACSNEIGCRPEVFATSFRYLINTEIPADLFGFEPVSRLNATYHVGEDFLDITDGLRAIDEVMLYMGFGAHNRLGHALALGIEPKVYYDIKKFQMILPKQDLLDNIVWLLGRSNKCKIPISHTLYDFLISLATKLSKDIYPQEPVEMTSYYHAWKLRGDDPFLYTNPSLVNTNDGVLDVLGFSECFRRNQHVGDDVRADLSACKWYHLYHFDGDAKKRGAEKTVFSLEDGLRNDYIRLVADTQCQLLAEIKQKEIYIEANPSSNLLIGTFERYENHPIFHYFGVGDAPENSACVSINTDDLGVFDTSLQNEFSLVATALSKHNHYSNNEIRTYLKSVQKFGTLQVFK